MSKKQKKTPVTTGASSIGFGTKNKIYTPSSDSAKEVMNNAAAKEKLSRRQIITIVAAALIVFMLSGLTAGLIIMIRSRNNPNYMTADLTRYIYISKEDYKNYTIDIPLDTADPSELTRRINTLLAEHKTADKVFGSSYIKNEPLSLGDLAYIYYRGYTVGEDGREIDFEGSSNFSSSDPVALEVGTGNIYENGSAKGQFINGFGQALIDINPADYSQFEKIARGQVAASDVVYLSYSVIGEGGNKANVVSERIDLSLSYIDEVYGNGFKAFITGKTIGEKLDTFTCRLDGHSTDTVYTDMKVDFVTRCEDNPLTIDVRFPANYSAEHLRGVEAKFDVYVLRAQLFDVPEFDEEFIKDKLKESEESLSAYTGATLVEKYRDKLQKEIEVSVEKSNHTILEDKMWEHLLSKVEVKRLPSKNVETYYNAYYNELNSAYANYKSAYSSLEEFAAAYFGLSDGESYEDYMRSEAEKAVTEKLLFYYIIRDADILPSDEEYNKIYAQLYDEIMDYYLDLHKEEFENLEGAEYDKELATLKEEIDSYYGEEYFRENVYYYYCTREMLKFANIVR